jgi:large subunit ribosomal protein L18
MIKKIKKIYLQQKKRYLKKIVGNSKRPRLAVFKSNRNIYGQLIDDETGNTLVFSSTLSKNLKEKINIMKGKGRTQEAAFIIGQDLAQKAKHKQIEIAVFDRGNKPYHGRIKNLADGARKEGLTF